MKKVLLATGLLALTFGACTKKESTKIPAPVIDTVYLDTNNHMAVDTSIIISGISDVRVNPWGSASLDLTVLRTMGLEQKVSMMITGLPENAKAEWSAQSGYTTFNTSLMLDMMFVKRGTYELKIASQTEKGKTTDYSINLVVDTFTTREANAMFISRLQSAFRTTDPIIDSVVYSSTSTYNDLTKSSLYLRNVVLSYDKSLTNYFISYLPTNSNNHVMIEFNAETGDLTIPEQQVNGRSISGGIQKTFTISGVGKVNLEKSMYEFTYTTEHDDAGTTVVKSYKLEGTTF